MMRKYRNGIALLIALMLMIPVSASAQTQEDVANAAMSMIVTTFSDQFDITYDYDGDSQCLGVKLVLKDVTAEIWNSYPSDTNVQLLDAFSGITDVLIDAANSYAIAADPPHVLTIFKTCDGGDIIMEYDGEDFTWLLRK